MNQTMNIEEIKEYLPHRYPFLLIDRVISFEKDQRLVAVKNVTVNEPFFQGHFPHYAVMPGVLIVEAMAQAAAVLSLKSLGHKNDGKWVYYFVGIVGHLAICDGVTISGFAFITKSITEPGTYTSGMPAMPHGEWLRNAAQLRHLDELARRVKKNAGDDRE